ncbi:MOP flippase family protein [Shewanella sp. 10N.286.51.B2]|uniref:MOP flippase family protein n=1 Tax=Shewanella sp. 10N.286.51.B2 TaxID=3229707 RepID=UPI003551E983
MSLKQKSLSGVKWTTLSAVINTVVQLTQLSIMAHYISPTNFGLLAIIMIVIGFSQMFMDMGISNAIIQRQNISQVQLSSLYWLNIFSGIIMTLVILILSPIISGFYEETDLLNPLLLLSSVFIIVAIGNQYRVLCQKYLKFDVMAKIEIISTITSFFVAVLLAVNEFGLYALVWAMLTQSAVSSVLFLLVGIKEFSSPNMVYDHKSLSGFYSFGLYQMGEKSINYISANADKILVSKFLGVELTGIYNMAWQLVIFPLTKINPILNKVAFPVYAKLQSDKKQLGEYYTVTVRSLSLITVPLLSFLSFYSYEIVYIVFGDGWELTAKIIPTLALVGLMKAVSNPGGALLLAQGYANVGFWWNLFWCLVVVLSIYLGLIYKPNIYSVPEVLLFLSLTIGWVWHYLISYFSKINCCILILHLFKITLICFSIGWLSRTAVEFFSFDMALVKLSTAGVLCLIMYSVYLSLFERSFIKKIFNREK